MEDGCEFPLWSLAPPPPATADAPLPPGGYQNYTPNELVDLTARIFAMVPPWTRVYRVQRDIPMPLVTSGVENGNLRELALRRMRDLVRGRGAVCCRRIVS